MNFWFYSSFALLFCILLSSHWIGKKINIFFSTHLLSQNQNSSTIKPPIAEILGFKGEINWRTSSDGSFQTLSIHKKSLNHWDRLRLNKNSYISLSFSSGYRVRIFGESEILLEYWSEPLVYLHLLYGRFYLEKKGEEGKLFIVQNGKIFKPSKRPKKIQARASLSHLKELNKLNPYQQNFNTDSIRLPQFKKSKDLPISYEFSNTKKNKSATLTNLSIERKLKSFRHKFKKCQLNALKSKEKPYGKTLLGLLIEPSGKIQKLNVIKSSVQSKDLKQCIFTLLRTLSFHSFQAPPVYAIYALNFEEEK